MEQAYSNLLQSRQKRNNLANKNKGLKALKLGDMVWKLLESVDKADPIWSNTVYHVIKGPYDGHHYDIRTPMGKSIRVARDQIKLAVLKEGTKETFMSLESFFENKIEDFDRDAFENFKLTASGKAWVSNARYAFKNFQILCPKKFKKLNGNDAKKFYDDENSYSSLIQKLNLIKRFMEDEVYRQKLLTKN